MNKCEIKVTACLKIYIQHASSPFDTNTAFYHHTSAVVQYLEQHLKACSSFKVSPPSALWEQRSIKFPYCALSFISGGDICLANAFSLVCTSVQPQKCIFCCNSLWNSIACHLFFLMLNLLDLWKGHIILSAEHRVNYFSTLFFCFILLSSYSN